ncbi:MAG: SPOR domain-containing protein [Phocaeicola sp.]
MIDLAKQIETLLLENDCVIVPDLGGFIAYNQPSYYNTSGEKFFPPIRTIGFNPQLVMNDGLLVQSYMQVYQTDFPDATRIVQREVNQLKNKLYQEGSFELKNIGRLNYNLSCCYSFTPTLPETLAPSLYGLPSFALEKLKPLQKELIPTATPSKISRKRGERTAQWVGYVSAAAIAILLFFTFSVPVENTYIEKGSYAALGTTFFFETILSPASTMTQSKEENQQKEKTLPANLKPITTRTETVAPKTEEKKTEEKKIEKVTIQEKAPVATVQQNTVKKHHVIIASLSTAEEAEQAVTLYKKKGFKEASCVKGGGRYRLSLANFTEMTAAYAKIKEFKDAGTFKDAWVLTTK